MKIQNIINENYIVSYDLRGKNRDNDYEKMEKELEDTFNAKRLLQSVWGLSSDLTDKKLHTHLKRFVKVGDGLLVVRKGAWVGSGLDNKLSSL